MVTKVKIFLSEQAKGKSKAGVALKTKSLSQGGGRNKVGKASPAKNLQVGSSRNRKKKVVKSAARPIQKVAAVKIVQPKKGDMQLSALSRAPELTSKSKGNGNQGNQNNSSSNNQAQSKNRGAKKQGPKSALSNQLNAQPNGRSKSGLNNTVAVQTAQVIAANGGHPRQRDVSDLLATLQKGWIDEKKFTELLQGILF